MGWQWVGEHGPEVIVMRPGTRVIANREARDMAIGLGNRSETFGEGESIPWDDEGGLEHAMAEVMAEVRRIEAQLGDRNRMVDGRRMTDHEWWEWRKKASAARNHKVELYRRMKVRLKELRGQVMLPGEDREAQKARRAAELNGRLDAIDERLARIERMLDGLVRGASI